MHVVTCDVLIHSFLFLFLPITIFHHVMVEFDAVNNMVSELGLGKYSGSSYTLQHSELVVFWSLCFCIHYPLERNTFSVTLELAGNILQSLCG